MKCIKEDAIDIQTGSSLVSGRRTPVSWLNYMKKRKIKRTQNM